MGDRFDRLGARHPNVEALLRRPGIGHNNGPTFDMSWEAWVWRRATATAWKQPSPEVAKMRIRRAERLGITYKELTAALMNTGSNLGAAVMPLSLAARVRRGAKGEIIVEPRNFVAALVARFGGRLFLLGDIDAVPALTDEERAEFLAIVNRSLDGKVEAIGWGHDGPADPRHAEVERRAAPGGLPGRCGHGASGARGERGSSLTKDIDSWFA